MSAAPLNSVVLSFSHALRAVEEQAARVAAGATESLDLLATTGRVLAEPLLADRDLPPFPRSTRDGYAVRSSDSSQLPATLDVIGEIKAGAKLDGIPNNIGNRQAVAIMTGAPVPAGADAVVMVEYTAQRGNHVEDQQERCAGGKRCSSRLPKLARASVLLDRGARLNEAAIALAASAGKSLLAGLQTSASRRADHRGRDRGHRSHTRANSDSQFEQLFAGRADSTGGRRACYVAHCPRRTARIASLIEEGLKADLLLLTGGVSMGRYDLVEQVLVGNARGIFLHRGKNPARSPRRFRQVCRGNVCCGEMCAGLRSATYFFGLPGNPVSTMVTFELFARPMLEALCRPSSAQPDISSAVLRKRSASRRAHGVFSRRSCPASSSIQRWN